jgi:hypothetical protein
MKTLALMLGISFLGALNLPAERPPPADPRYGPYPAHYKEIVYNWLKSQLEDVDSAKIEWEGDPKPSDLGQNGEHLYGWLANFKINARNRFGVFTGKQKHAALIRNGEVVKGVGYGY